MRNQLANAAHNAAVMALLVTPISTWVGSTPSVADEAALQPAARVGNDAVIRRLLAKGVDVSHLGDASAALSDAIANTHISTVRLLLKAGVNLNLAGDSEHAPNASGKLSRLTL
jgi:hypothetical protein